MSYDVLITGGTGFLGRALAARLLQSTLAERICIYSRGEYAQATMRQDIHDPDGRLRWFIGDVRDTDRLERAMEGVGYVIHAAALKRIEVGDYCPDELVKTNVYGSMNVIAAARRTGVARVLLVSTDKAYQPVSPYGQSKALAESLFLKSNVPNRMPRFSAVRYGNVWNSTGSVLPTWRGILKHSDTVPVTDPDATRFFMWQHEAVSLVLDTMDTMLGGEIVIPELPAYRLGDLATALGARMNIIGMPSREKQHESMSEDKASDKAPRLTIQQLQEAIDKT